MDQASYDQLTVTGVKEAVDKGDLSLEDVRALEEAQAATAGKDPRAGVVKLYTSSSAEEGFTLPDGDPPRPDDEAIRPEPEEG